MLVALSDGRPDGVTATKYLTNNEKFELQVPVISRLSVRVETDN